MLVNINDEKNFVEYLKNLNGNFTIILKKENKYFIASDRINSFPLFYSEAGNEILIGDNAKEMAQYLSVEKLINEQALLEIAAMGYTLGNKTLYRDISLLGPGEYLVVDLERNVSERKSYFVHSHTEKYPRDEKFLLKKLDSVIKSTFDRLVQSTNGHQIVLFLSGGYDSRLILLNLHKRQYRNVVCVSLRSKLDKDVQVAKTIAHKLGYRFLSVDFNKEYWRKRSAKSGFWSLMDTLFNGVALYYPQGLVIEDLKKQKLIDEDSVILTGNSGDVVEGNDVSDKFEQGETYSKKEIIDEIISTHCLNIISRRENYDKIFMEISHYIVDKKSYSFVDAQNIFEWFNWYERQCKYVTSDVRNYDAISGNEWRLPLWDHEFVDFWLNVPIDYRFKRKLYYQYVKNDNMPTANVATAYDKVRSLFINRCGFLLDYAYFVRQIVGYLGREIPFAFCGVVSFREWCKILWFTRRNKVKFLSAWMYKLFLEKHGFNIFLRFK